MEIATDCRSQVEPKNLPHYAQLAIERVQCDSTLRDTVKLDELLEGYAASTGASCCDDVREQTHSFCLAHVAGFEFVGIGIRL